MNRDDRIRLLKDLEQLEAERRASGYQSPDVSVRIQVLHGLLSALTAADWCVECLRAIHDYPSNAVIESETNRTNLALAAWDAATGAKEGAAHPDMMPHVMAGGCGGTGRASAPAPAADEVREWAASLCDQRSAELFSIGRKTESFEAAVCAERIRSLPITAALAARK